MIIRELVTAFGIDFDDSGAKKAESAVGRLNDVMGKIGLGLSFWGVYEGFKTVLGLASSVEEEANVLRQTFGEVTDQVNSWADANAAAMGRSAVDLRKYAGQLGAVLEPMLGNKQAAADMSTQLAQLSVDLASFFNKGDEETMERLRSGMLGSSEAVDQLGINLREEHVQAVMAEQGIKKKFRTMSEGEKVQMRFLAIMKDTAAKQGDAARTLGGYANQLKASQANVKDLGIAIGDRLMPAAKGAIGLFAEFSGWLLDIVKNSAAVETTLTLLGAVATMIGARFMIANAGALFFGAGVVAAGVVLEDLYTSLEGGEGYFADFFKWAMGEDKWAKVLDAWRYATKELGDLIWEMTHPEEMRRRHGASWSKDATTKTGGFFPLDPTTGKPWAPGASGIEDALSYEKKTGRPGWIQLLPAPLRGAYSVFSGESLPPATSQLSKPAPTASGAQESHWWDFMMGDLDPRTGRPRGGASESAVGSLAGAVDGLSGAVQRLPANASGVPMSLPMNTTTNTTNMTLRSGDVHMSVGPGATPDTLREARRIARELVEDQNRSLVDSASAR